MGTSGLNLLRQDGIPHDADGSYAYIVRWEPTLLGVPPHDVVDGVWQSAEAAVRWLSAHGDLWLAEQGWHSADDILMRRLPGWGRQATVQVASYDRVGDVIGHFRVQAVRVNPTRPGLTD